VRISKAKLRQIGTNHRIVPDGLDMGSVVHGAMQSPW
jgi:cytidylate kinase